MQSFVKLCEYKINFRQKKSTKQKNKYQNFLYFFVKDFYRNKKKKDYKANIFCLLGLYGITFVGGVDVVGK